jgi:hypothetical protein
VRTRDWIRIRGADCGYETGSGSGLRIRDWIRNWGADCGSETGSGSGVRIRDWIRVSGSGVRIRDWIRVRDADPGGPDQDADPGLDLDQGCGTDRYPDQGADWIRIRIRKVGSY